MIVGKLLVSLEELKLHDSYIPTIRDLGSGFKNLTVLWMSRCNVRDLDGIASFSNLRELYLAYNEIRELEDISRLENLEILDLEGYIDLKKEMKLMIWNRLNIYLCVENYAM